MFKKALVLAPHTDDGELGCGGTIHRLVREGCKVDYVAFSICEESVPDGLPKDILATEVMEATKVLGIPSENVVTHRFPVRHFPAKRQEILEVLIKLRRELEPEIVLVPASYDVHQDHGVICSESIRAFRNCCLVGYELPWNNIEFKHLLYFRLSAGDVAAKQAAIKCYRSQGFRNYDPDMFLQLAKLRGGQSGSDLAEAFEILRWIV